MNRSLFYTVASFFFLLIVNSGAASETSKPAVVYNEASKPAVVSESIDADSTWNLSLDQVVISSLRMDRIIKDVPAPMSVARAIDYQRNSSLSLSGVLRNEPGISMGGDGIWSTGINIRGMGESRQVILVDGNRVETATDLTASLSMIDVNDIDRVEVIKGAQSSLYGTGAMGGIVNIITKDGYFAATSYLSGSVISGYASANSLFSNYASINSGSESWYLRVSGTSRDAGEMRTPEGTLPNSQFTANNLSVKTGFKPLENHLIKLQYQQNRGIDVGIPGGDAFPGPATASYSDINRQLLNASYEISNIGERLSSVKLNYFTQYIVRDVELFPNTVNNAVLPNGNTQRTTPELFTPTGKHLTHGVQLQSNWQLSPANSLIAGIDVWGRRLTTSREKYITVEVFNPGGDLLATNSIERGETPIPESNFSSAGIFFQNESALLDGRLTLITGGRIDRVWINSERGYDVDYIVLNGNRNDNPPTARVTFEEGEEQSFSWSANAGALYRLWGNVDASVNVARSFRAPSLEERFKYIDLGSFVRLGDPALKPESGFSADMGLRVWNPGFNLRSGIFVNRINNMIVEVPGEFIYTLASGGDPLTLPAFINSNVSEALLYGFDFSIDYNFYDNLVLLVSGSYVRGKNITAGEDLPMIPPLNGRLGIRYSKFNLGSVELAVTGASKQERIAVGETATDGYYYLDLMVNSKRFRFGGAGLQFFAGIDNITDVSYTNHLATNRGSISVEPGRNIFGRVVVTF